MPSRFLVTTPATYEDVTLVRKVLPLAAAGLGFPHETLLRLEICLTEALHNVVRHAYRGRSGTMSVAFLAGDGRLEIEIADEGTPMPERARAALRSAPPIPDRASAPVVDLPEGGLGIPILRSVLDTVEYRTDGRRNVLRLVKHAPDGAPARTA